MQIFIETIGLQMESQYIYTHLQCSWHPENVFTKIFPGNIFVRIYMCIYIYMNISNPNVEMMFEKVC